MLRRGKPMLRGRIKCFTSASFGVIIKREIIGKRREKNNIENH